MILILFLKLVIELEELRLPLLTTRSFGSVLMRLIFLILDTLVASILGVINKVVIAGLLQKLIEYLLTWSGWRCFMNPMLNFFFHASLIIVLVFSVFLMGNSMELVWEMELILIYVLDFGILMVNLRIGWMRIV